MWNKLFKHLFHSYLTDFLILAFLAAAAIIIIVPSPVNMIISLTLILTVIVFILLFAKMRKRELSQILKSISGIRRNTYSAPKDIILGAELKELEDEIKLMFGKMLEDIAYLKKLEKMRTEFLANVSHELRTPIFTIQGYLETLIDGAIVDNAVNRKFLEKAALHTISLSNLVNDLIDISMIESGEMRMSFRYFNINDFLMEMVGEMKQAATDKNLELIFIPPRSNLQLLGDKTRLKQVMSNLILNAVKYTDAGKIEISVEEGTKTADIIVADTGIGIPEEDTDRIFERFYRVDKARSRAVGGTGLGLAIVKHIVEAHNSKIYLKSRVNEGSEFRFGLKK